MPSGAKRRKAAKKKKEQEASSINSSTNNSPHENDDPKSQDERDSDGGDAGSCVSQDDHNHQHSSNLGEEEGRAPPPDQSHVTEDKSVEEATGDAESIEKFGLNDVVDVHFVEELELKEDIVSTDVNIHLVEHGKSSSSSSPSSSDDESQASEKKLKEEASNFPSEATSHGNVDKSAAVKFEEDVKFAEIEVPVNVSYSIAEAVAVKSEDDEKFAEKETPHSVGETSAVETILPVSEEVDQATEISIKKSVVSDAIESGYKEIEENLLPSSNGDSRVTLEEKTMLPVSEEVDRATEISINKSVVSHAIESGHKEIEENLLPTSNGISRDTLEENEGKVFPSSDTVNAESSNVVGKTQDPETPDYSEKQPLVASTPPMVPRTSVFNCCGLFDVFASSGR